MVNSEWLCALSGGSPIPPRSPAFGTDTQAELPAQFSLHFRNGPCAVHGDDEVLLAKQVKDRLRNNPEQADIIISSTSCPHTILSREEAELLVRGRIVEDQPLVIVDIAMPRDIDPEVRQVKGAFLYDIDDLENVVAR